ncbi:sugar kinase [bacterium]|nr:MAG: sugar kinase [bacterium]
MTYRLGIDLGGTKIEGILIDEQFQVIKRERVPTKREEGYEAILSRIVKLAKSIIKDVPDLESPIGICTPGTIESETGLLKNSNTVCLIGKPIQKDMEGELGIPVVMENDANCFALAEATIGAAKKYNVVFGVILGTGCGGGITMLRNIHRGANRIAGEWGHHCLVPGGRECYCGNRGCTEAYISGTALEKEWFELSGERSRVTDIIESGNYKNHPEWKENFLKNFGRGLANVIDILDPHAIVLGGGLSRIDFLYTEGKESVYKETFSKIVRTPILKNKLGDSAGVFGAAMLADIY